MMKKSLLFVCLAFLSFVSAFGQTSFTVVFSQTSQTGNTNSLIDFGGNIFNNSVCCPTSVSMSIVSSNLPTGWELSFCDPFGCHLVGTLNSSFTMTPSDTGYAALTFHTSNTTGTGYAILEFRDINDTLQVTSLNFDATILTNGIADNSTDDFNYMTPNFPNPLTTTSTISYKLPSNKGSFQIVDVTGKQISGTILNNAKGTITIGEGLSKGIFFCTLKDENGTSLATRKIIVH